MRSLIISTAVLEKLKNKHGVTRREVEQCFENKVGNYLSDDREDHKTDPVTLWFVSLTNCNRLLKITFIFVDGNIHIKSAYEPSDAVIEIYDRRGK
jgi:hypothetical protein